MSMKFHFDDFLSVEFNINTKFGSSLWQYTFLHNSTYMTSKIFFINMSEPRESGTRRRRLQRRRESFAEINLQDQHHSDHHSKAQPSVLSNAYHHPGLLANLLRWLYGGWLSHRRKYTSLDTRLNFVIFFFELHCPVVEGFFCTRNMFIRNLRVKSTTTKNLFLLHSISISEMRNLFFSNSYN